MTIDHTVKSLQSCDPVRNVWKSGSYGFKGFAPWYDMSRLMEPGTNDVLLNPESKLEADFLLIKRFDRTLLKMRDQPCEFQWWNPILARYSTHVPDFEGTTAVDRIYFQIKTDQEAAELQHELEWIGEAIRSEGHRFEVWKKSDIYGNPHFSNCELLCEEAGPLENIEARETVEKLLANAGRSLSIGVIRRATNLHADGLRAVLRLFVLGKVDFDLNQWIDDKTIVRWLG